VQLIFTKGPGKHDRLELRRNGLTSEHVECPKQGIIPHEMVHFAVESVLERRGFVTQVIDGEGAAFQMVSDAESEGVERLVEVFQADGWSGWGSRAADMLELYLVTCEARHCAPLPLDSADIEAVRAQLLSLTSQWGAVAIGASLVLQFDPQAA